MPFALLFLSDVRVVKVWRFLKTNLTFRVSVLV